MMEHGSEYCNQILVHVFLDEVKIMRVMDIQIVNSCGFTILQSIVQKMKQNIITGFRCTLMS